EAARVVVAAVGAKQAEGRPLRAAAQAARVALLLGHLQLGQARPGAAARTVAADPGLGLAQQWLQLSRQRLEDRPDDQLENGREQVGREGGPGGQLEK